MQVPLVAFNLLDIDINRKILIQYNSILVTTGKNLGVKHQKMIYYKKTVEAAWELMKV